ncbi:MAG: hypothetical protein CL843_18715 [Crocinitomicaceae bacterium]|nr:hypothetical protein [Crocinitomicaceae bacterium]|tara:strand:- start:6908 stop:8317 length:1410 start_codon:yes stop_codon:yes gene_type:complete
MKKIFSLVLTLMGLTTMAQIPNGTFPTTGTSWFSTGYPINCSLVENSICVTSSGWDGSTDHTPGDNLLMVDGRSTVDDANLIWGYTASVTTNATYQFSFWVDPRNWRSVNDIEIEVFADGVSLGGFTNSGANGWQQVIKTFTATSSTVDLEIRQSNSGAFTDFNLDDLLLTGLEEGPCELVSDYGYSQNEETCGWNFWSQSYVGNASTNIIGYLWDFGNGVITTEQNPSLFLEDGTYTVCLTTYAYNDYEEGGCCSEQECKTVTIVNDGECAFSSCSIELDFEADLETAPCTYVFTPNIYSSGRILGYYWDFGDGATSNEESPSHSFDDGVYEVCLTVLAIDDEGSCCTETYCEEIQAEGCDELPGGLEGLDFKKGSTTATKEAPSEVSLYPNPTSEILNVNVTSKKDNSGHILVMNNMGQLVNDLTEKVMFNEGDNQFQLDTKSLSAGIYIINIEMDGEMISKKFIKE